MPFPIALAASLLPAIYQGAKGLVQKDQASNLKESTFIPPELLMNKELARQQAYSRRSPGQARSESLTQRAQANQISAAERNFGGDTNKVAALTSAATAQANDANARTQVQGDQFSENAFGREAQANSAIAGQKRQNLDEYNRAKESLLYASDQNIFNGINNAASATLTAYNNGDFGGENSGGGGGGGQSANGGIGGLIGAEMAKQPPTRSYTAWQDYQGVQNMQNFGYNPYNYGQQQYQDNGVWRQPGYSAPQYNMNVAPRMNRRFYR